VNEKAVKASEVATNFKEGIRASHAQSPVSEPDYEAMPKTAMGRVPR
jgi:hypothetical protein